MGELSEILDRLEANLSEVDELDGSTRGLLFDVLDGIDTVHRLALTRLAGGLDEEQLRSLRAADPAVEWLFSAYGLGVDERAAAESALESVRPFIHSHGGEVEVVGAEAGRVRVRMSGSCSGCTASAVTLTQGVEEALREGLPGFVALEVEDDPAPSHAPPGQTLLQIGRSTG